MEVTFRHEVPFGHRLPNHPGKCRFPHGHNYLFEVTLSGPTNDDGMVVDFHDLKKITREFFSMFDHAFVLWEHDPLAIAFRAMNDGAAYCSAESGVTCGQLPTKVVVLNVVPTAENLAQLVRVFIHEQFSLRAKVTCYEQRDCWAKADGAWETVRDPQILEMW